MTVVADLFDDADQLVTDRMRRPGIAQAAVAPEVGAADARGDHAHDGVAGREDARVRSVLDPDVAHAVLNDGAHQAPSGSAAAEAFVDAAVRGVDRGASSVERSEAAAADASALNWGQRMSSSAVE